MQLIVILQSHDVIYLQLLHTSPSTQPQQQYGLSVDKSMRSIRKAHEWSCMYAI